MDYGTPNAKRFHTNALLQRAVTTQDLSTARIPWVKFDTCEPLKDIREEQESISNCKVMFKFLTEGPITSWNGNILGIAQAICTRSNRVLGFVHQYRVHLLMKGFCRAANSCEASLIVGALRVACNGLCTAARFHSAMKPWMPPGM